MDRSILKLGPVTHGCEDEDACLRHRPLAGQAQHAIRRAVAPVASVVVFALLPAWQTDRGGVPSETYVAQTDYVRAFLPSVGPSSSDADFEQIPLVGWDWPVLTWTLAISRSGKLTIHGDEANFFREFWEIADTCLRDGHFDQFGESEGRISGGRPFRFEFSFPRFGLSDHIWTSWVGDDIKVHHEFIPESLRWRVAVSRPGVVTFEGPVPEDARRVWRRLARSPIRRCGEPRVDPPRVIAPGNLLAQQVIP